MRGTPSWSSQREIDLDERLTRWARHIGGHGDPFSAVLEQARARPEHETVLAEYLDLVSSGEASSRAVLKLLAALDELRSPEVSRQGFRTARIGASRRARWPQHPVKPERYRLEEGRSTRKARRSLQSVDRSPIPILPIPGDEEDHAWGLSDDAPVMDMSSVLLLHMCFVGNDLVLALDENLQRFCYGRDAVSTGKVEGSAFSEFGYTADDLDPDGVVWGPIVRKRVRARTVALANEIHGWYEQNLDRRPDSKLTGQWASELDGVVGFKELSTALTRWCKARTKKLTDVCLVFLPDEALVLLPLGFLGLGHERPLVADIGGTCIAPSLVALKKSLVNHHWGFEANRRGEAPTCTYFAANHPQAQWLDLAPELDAVRRSFGEDRFLAVPSALKNEFRAWYSAGDICWFSGHGCFYVNRGIELDGGLLPLPESGPLFADGPVLNLDLITTSLWNFKSIWLAVLNSCVLGRHYLAGPNAIGFMSALETVGCSSTIGALWPVENDVATELARVLSEELVQAYNDRAFPRARALGRGIKRMLDADSSRAWELAPYVLWGLP